MHPLLVQHGIARTPQQGGEGEAEGKGRELQICLATPRTGAGEGSYWMVAQFIVPACMQFCPGHPVFIFHHGHT